MRGRSALPGSVPTAARAAAESRSSALAQHIADTAHGMEQRLAAAVVDLLAKPADVHVDDVGAGVEVIVPHFFEHHRPRDDLPLVAQQQLEQAELARLKVDAAAAPLNTARQQVHGEI